MRILLVTDFYHPWTGGVESHVRTIAWELARRGHEVAVATLTSTPGSVDRTADGPVAVFPVEHTDQRLGNRRGRTSRSWAPPVPDPVAMAGLKRVVDRFEPDVIHGHDWLARSVEPAPVSGAIPYLVTHHYYTRSCAKKTLWRDGGICEGPSLRRCLACANDHYGTGKGAAIVAGLRIGSRLEDRRARWQISVSAATEDGNGLSGSARSIVIPNPVTVADDSGNGPDRIEIEEAADRVGALLPDGDFILFIGDIRVEKGLTVLIGAVDRLRKRGVDTPLVVVGERMTDAIELPPGTIEVGPVPHAVVGRLWAKATVGVVPSQWAEPFGLVAVEALAAGCPLIASDVGGLSEIVGDGAGVLVPPGDAEALADELDELLADPVRRAELARRGPEAVARYDLGTVVDELEHRYRLAVGG